MRLVWIWTQTAEKRQKDCRFIEAKSHPQPQATGSYENPSTLLACSSWEGGNAMGRGERQAFGQRVPPGAWIPRWIGTNYTMFFGQSTVT